MPDHISAIAAIRALPAQLQHAVAGLTPAQLVARPHADEWSIAQNVHHLADSHMTAYIRCKLIASEDRPPLKAYDQDAWAALPDGSNADISTSLTLLAALHVRWADFFATLAASDWQRVGIHSASGEVSLERQLIGYAAHGKDHLTQIDAVKAALGLSHRK
ncbi:MAG: DinB family protein [Roseiflexaceae bacterium]|jgi:hypothetical protein